MHVANRSAIFDLELGDQIGPKMDPKRTFFVTFGSQVALGLYLTSPLFPIPNSNQISTTIFNVIYSSAPHITQFKNQPKHI